MTKWVTCALVLGLAGGAFAQGPEPTPASDDAAQSDVVTLDEVPPIAGLSLRARAIRGQDTMTLSFVRTGPTWAFRECHRLQAELRGSAVELASEHEGQESNEGVTETVSVVLSASDLEALLQDAASLRLCNESLVLADVHEEALRRFVARWQPRSVELHPAVAEVAPEPPVEPTPTEPPPPAVADAPMPTADAPTDAGRIPVNLALHGYYRARYNWFGNVPQADFSLGVSGSNQAHFAYQRLRLEPVISYGNDPDKPIASVHVQVDALDNVVFGDNARIVRTPIFAADPSYTDVEGFDLADSFRIERAWLEVLLPVGQLRVGRMPSQWGLGLLANDGNGLGEWGDPLFGTSFDRVLFATRPLTVINALTSGDTRPTPLIFAIAYDKLVEDPVVASTTPPEGAISIGPFGPLGTVSPGRSTVPFQAWSGEGNDVNQMAVAMIWNDPDAGPRSTDTFTLGGYYVYRWQHRGGALRPLPTDAQASRVHITDLYWKLDYGLGGSRPSIYTEGEIVHIGGRTNTVTLAGPGRCQSSEEGICNETNANLWGGAFRAGARKHGVWGALLEWGFSSGDGQYFNDDNLRARPLHPDYHVGLIMYQVALSTMTAVGFGEEIRPLWSRGGVWNSHYVYPQFRFHLIPGFELHTAVLAAWARELIPTVYAHQRDDLADTACGAFENDCHVGMEVDVALRVKWGTNDLLRWDTEVGFMRAGNALVGDTYLADRFLWTVQTRMAMVF
ncbi:MAG: hypothetical protein H6720_00780 [Sandaracinus sp.]|nr:hypothetical protein [Sandaracinus sp.]